MNAYDRWLDTPYETAAVNHAALQEKIMKEADLRLGTWMSIGIADQDSHDYEVLQNYIAYIVHEAARALAAPLESSAMELLGNYVALMVKREALRVATHVVTE